MIISIKIREDMFLLLFLEVKIYFWQHGHIVLAYQISCQSDVSSGKDSQPKKCLLQKVPQNRLILPFLPHTQLKWTIIWMRPYGYVKKMNVLSCGVTHPPLPSPYTTKLNYYNVLSCGVTHNALDNLWDIFCWCKNQIFWLPFCFWGIFQIAQCWQSVSLMMVNLVISESIIINKKYYIP